MSKQDGADGVRDPSSGTRKIPEEIASSMEEYRRRIDQLDIELVRLLNARAACALEIGRLKDGVGMPTYQPGREIDVHRHVQDINGGPLDGGAIKRLFERIIDENRRLERQAKGEGR